MPGRDDFELMAAIGRGDGDAFEALYTKYKGPVANFLYKMSWDAALSEELLQEVFLSIWRTAARFEARAKVSTYLFTLARNAFINASRKGANRREAEGAVQKRETAPLDEADPDREHASARVKAAIEALPEDEREALVLAYYNSLPYHEIAEIQGIPVGTVKSRVHRALGRLRDVLNP